MKNQKIGILILILISSLFTPSDSLSVELTASFSYDSQNRLSSVVYQSAEQLILENFAHDNLGNIVRYNLLENAPAYWTKTSGLANDDYLASIQPTNDGGFVAVGRTNSDGFGDFDALIVKLDEFGNTQWQKIYGGANNDQFSAVQQTADGGFIVAGFTSSFGTSYWDCWVVKLDADGNKQWEYEYDNSGCDQISFLQQTADGGFLVIGESNWLLKLDGAGAIQWHRSISAGESHIFHSAVETTDGEYLLVGMVDNPDLTNGHDGWVVKIDAAGTVLSSWFYGGTGTDMFRGAVQVPDGGYILAGQTGSYGSGGLDAWLVRIDGTGAIQWQKAYGGNLDDLFRSIHTDGAQGFIAAGSTNSFGAGAEDMWIVHFDQTGSVSWSKTYGSSGSDSIEAAESLAGGELIVAGWTDGFGAGASDALLMNLNPLDVINSDCGLSSEPSFQIVDTSAQQNTLDVFENTFTGSSLAIASNSGDISLETQTLCIGFSDDTDGDGIADSWEIQWFGDLSHDGAGHSDNDALTDLDEFIYGTNPIEEDSDNDGFSDSDEIDSGTDPNDYADFPPLPLISSIQPTQASPGDEITLQGTDFGESQDASTVSFAGGVQAQAITSWSDTQITCTVPEGARTGCVTVTTANGASNCIELTILDGQYLYVVDNGVRVVHKLTIEGEYVASIGQGYLTSPQNCLIDSQGNLVVADDVDFKVFRDGNYLTTFGGDYFQDSISFARYLTIDSTGNIYTSGYVNGKIEVFDPTYNHLSTLDFTDQLGGRLNGQGIYQYEGPVGLSFDPISGNIIFSTVWCGGSGDRGLFEITTDGAFVREFGDSYDSHYEVKVDPDGIIYVMDQTSVHEGIKIYDQSRNLLDVWLSGHIAASSGIGFDDDGNIYVNADAQNIEVYESYTAASPSSIISSPNFVSNGGLSISIEAQNRVWFVNGAVASSGDGTSWSQALMTVQEALQNASAGDEIWVAGGTYVPGTNRSDTFQLVGGVALYGGFNGTENFREQRDWNANPTILSGDVLGNDIGFTNNDENIHHVVTAADNAVVDGFTISGGNADVLSYQQVGGGLFADGVNINIANCTFINNFSTRNGGAVYLGNGAISEISNCAWSNNESDMGGGIYAVAGSLTLSGSLFQDNSAVFGAGICLRSDIDAVVTNSIFRNNLSDNGGGIWIQLSSPLIQNCVFENNAPLGARINGGGGGICNETASPTIANCTFFNNSAVENGGALLNFAGSNPTVQNSIFWNNTALVSGDEIHVRGGSLTIGYSDIAGGIAGIDIGTDGSVVDDGGNIDSDPLFGTDFHLQSGSPCIDAGDPASAYPDFPTIDIDGETRPQGGQYDIGADEFLDADLDGLPDYWELEWFGDLSRDGSTHSDSDGLTDLDEYQYGTDPTDIDSDGDGISDGEEIAFGTDPNDPADTPNLLISVDGDPSDWSGYYPAYADPEGDSICNSDADLQAVYNAMDENFVYLMVQTYGVPIKNNAVFEIRFDYQLDDVNYPGEIIDLGVNIGDGYFNAWIDSNGDGQIEEYPIDVQAVVVGDVLEVRIPREELGDPDYFNVVFINIWDYDLPDPICDPDDIDYRIYPTIANARDFDETLGTFIKVQLEDGFAANLPERIDSLEVRSPTGDVICTLADMDFNPLQNTFFYTRDGPAELGACTFTVTSGTVQAISTSTLDGVSELPFPDPTSLLPAAGATIETPTPTFSFQLTENSDVPVYFGIEVADMAGNQIVMSESLLGDNYGTLPGGLLAAGQTYQWRALVGDARQWSDVQNLSTSDWQTFTMAATLYHDAVPAVDLDGWGVVTWNTEYGTGLDVWVKVVDHDGIASGGSSHQVTLRRPDNQVYDLHYQYSASGSVAYYSTYIGYDGGTPEPGDYIFTVSDPDENTGTITDTLQGTILDPPDGLSIAPTLQNPVAEFITASFDNIVVNGSAYEDFSTYATIDDIDTSRWLSSWCDSASIVDQHLVLEKFGILGSGGCQQAFASPETINAIQADITVDSVSSGRAKARIAGYFFNADGIDNWAQIAVFEDRVVYNVHQEVPLDGYVSWQLMAEGELMNVSVGQTVTVGVDWDGSVLTFSADGNTATYTPAGVVGPPQEAYKELSAKINLQMDTTTPTFTWDPVPGANRYRVRIYTDDGSRTVWRGYTGSEPTYTVPPGVLVPYGDYRFRVEARDSHDPIEIDNASKFPGSNGDNIRFTSGADTNEPFIDLSSGVSTWTTVDLGSFLSFYIKVYDKQGVPDDIRSVTVRFPDGAQEVLYYDPASGQNTATRGVYRTDSFLPIQAGTYTFTVEDRAGHRYSDEEVLTPDAIGFPDEGLMSPAPYTVLNSTAVDFQWEAVDGTAFYELEITDAQLNHVGKFYTTDNFYSLPPGYLAEESLYRYRVKPHREFYDQNSDNGASSPAHGFDAVPFITTGFAGGSATPVIDPVNEGAMVLYNPDPAGDRDYRLEFIIQVTDDDGLARSIASATVTFPDGLTTIDLLPYVMGDGSSALYWNEVLYSDPALIPEGDYTFTVRDFDGNQAQYTDNLVKAPIATPQNLSPAQDSVVYSTTPIISWDAVPEATTYRVRLYDGWMNTLLWSDYLTGTQFEVPANLLSLNRTYSYRVYAYREAAGTEDADNYAYDGSNPSERPHFTVVESTDADGDGLPDALDPDPMDADTDDDGLVDGNAGSEDLNANGIVEPGETDPLNPDTDGDGIFDGTERGLTAPETADTDTGAGFFVADQDPSTTSDPTDADTDEDGILDGNEDLNRDGMTDTAAGETDPGNPDTDGDGINDATEMGLTEPQDPAATDLSAGNFVADADPATTTNPYDADSDDDGILDGNEDLNHDGLIDPTAGESDPLNADSDGDGIYDGTEIGLTVPQDPGATDLSQGNFVPSDNPDLVSDPTSADSDADGFDDPVEISVGSNPSNADSFPHTTTVQLHQGFNLVAIPAEVLGNSDLRDWLDTFGTGTEIDRIMAYDRAQGTFVTLIPGAADNPAFTLQAGTAVYVYALQGTEVAFDTLLSAPIDLQTGTNLVGFSAPPADYSAYDVLTGIGSANVVSIQRYNPEKGAFETAAFDESGNLNGVDFPISTGEGYSLQMRQGLLGF